VFIEGSTAHHPMHKAVERNVNSLASTTIAGKSTAVDYISCQLRHEYYFAPNTTMSKVVAFKGTEQGAPADILRKVPSRPKNRDVRSREHLLPDEVDALMKQQGRSAGIR